jgi:hypothetical protein
MKRLDQVFIEFGDTSNNTSLNGAKPFGVANTPAGTQSFNVDFTAPGDATVRFIITASDRYGQLTGIQDSVFPVGYILWPEIPDPSSFQIQARNCDTNTAGGSASFFWLAIAEDAKPTATLPLNQIFAGQPAAYAPRGSGGDHQMLPNVSGLVDSLPTKYNFSTSFAPGSFQPTVKGRPVIFATANNLGCGVSPYQQPHNAAAVPIVQDNWSRSYIADPEHPGGFTLNSCNSDTAGGLCGFNWVALQQRPAGSTPSQHEFIWSVDTGAVFDDVNLFSFAPDGQVGDWVSAEVQFSEPFALPPVVLTTAIVPIDQDFGPPGAGPRGCAPVPMAQNVTRFGFTLAARNSDTNENGGLAFFHWAAFGIAESDLLTTLTT